MSYQPLADHAAIAAGQAELREKQHELRTPYDYGRIAGYRGSDYSRGEWTDGQDWLEWYEGWKAGRAAAEAEVVERVGVKREFVRHYRLLGRHVA